MRFTLFFLLLGIIQVSATVSYSQQTRMSLRFENASVKDVLNEIENQSDYYFLYNQDLIDVSRRVSFRFDEAKISVILDQLFEKTDVRYQIENRQIILTNQNVSNVSSQVANIKSTVTDSSGAPLPGATVIVKGTTNGTITDFEGNYTLSDVSANSILVVSFMGMKTLEMPVSDKSVINVKMEEDAIGIEEVVAVGYGTLRKRDITGATSSVKADVITSRPITAVEQALQGTTPGVVVQSANGMPGKGASVRIRGTNSLTGSNEPLYVIDGCIGGSLQSVPPEDIESLEILKDASATAIYGSRGSNGVVIITTKRGEEGKMRVGFNTWISQASMPNYMDVMDGYDFAVTKNKVNSLKGLAPAFSQQQLSDLEVNRGTDWQREVTQTPIIQNYQVSLSGGGDKIKYFISGNYLDQPGLYINQWYNKGSLRANMDIKANDKLDLKFSLVGSKGKSHNTDWNGDGANVLALAAAWDPSSPIKDENGNYIAYSQHAEDRYNPVATMNNRAVDNTSSNFIGIGSLTYQIAKGLTFTSTVSYENSYGLGQSVFGPETSQGAESKDGVSARSNQFWEFQNSNYFTYKNSFGEHDITVTALYEQQQAQNTTIVATSGPLSTYALGYYNLGLGEVQTTNSSYWEESLQSFMGRINYTYKDKYLVTVSLRDDGSSHLTEKYSLFPSLALGWNITSEEFLKDVTLLSNLKLRISWGKTGNQAVGAYATIPKVGVGKPYYYTGSPSVTTPVGTAVTKSLRWETTTQFNAGIDAAFLQGRLTFTADAYQKTVNDLLYDYPAPDYLGGGTYKKNLGTLENKGLELSLGGVPVKRAVKWDTFFTISFNRNKIVDLGGLDNVAIGVRGSGLGTAGLLKVGRPMAIFQGYHFLGTWKTSEAAEAAKYGSKPGEAKYEDVNGNGSYDSGDFVEIGSGMPKYSYAFTNNVSYKNLSLNVMFQGMQGNQNLNFLFAEVYGGVGDARDATSSDVKNEMWTPENETDFPISGSAHNFPQSSRFVYDAGFIKLKNVSLSYRLPGKVLNKIKSRGLELYVSGQNILTITKYKGFDPETTSAENPLTQGFDVSSLPNPKTYTIGLRASF